MWLCVECILHQLILLLQHMTGQRLQFNSICSTPATYHCFSATEAVAVGLEPVRLLHMLLAEECTRLTCKLLVRSVLGDLDGQAYEIRRGICVAYALWQSYASTALFSELLV